VHSFDPAVGQLRLEGATANRALKRRYFLVEQARTASVIGILVGTLGVAQYTETIAALRKLIIASGRKPYVFVVGKLNSAKLANFAEVDCFVLVACPENSLIDARDLLRPVLTPYEIHLALSQGIAGQWTGKYVTDFSQVLPRLSERLKEDVSEDNETDQSSEMMTHMSLVSGRMISTKSKEDENTNLQGPQESEVLALKGSHTDGSIVTRVTPGALSSTVVGPAQEFLQSRSFKGLERCIGQTPVALAVDGLSGIASQYDKEKDQPSC